MPGSGDLSALASSRSRAIAWAVSSSFALGALARRLAFRNGRRLQSAVDKSPSMAASRPEATPVAAPVRLDRAGLGHYTPRRTPPCPRRSDPGRSGSARSAGPEGSRPSWKRAAPWMIRPPRRSSPSGPGAPGATGGPSTPGTRRCAGPWAAGRASSGGWSTPTPANTGRSAAGSTTSASRRARRPARCGPSGWPGGSPAIGRPRSWKSAAATAS